MNKMGKIIDAYRNVKSTIDKIKNSYIYKLFSKICSFFCTVILIFLLVVGALMFYFNMKAKEASEKGEFYTAPFGLYTIISGSMQPSINVYDVVVSAKVSDLNKIKVGDIITFISNWEINYGTTVTHRVVSISKTETGEFQFATKGDYNKSPDGAVVTQNNLIGKVVMRIPNLGRLQFFLATKMGWFIVIFIPAMFIVVLDLIKIFKLYLLKDSLDKVEDTEVVEKKYFDGELLENRDINVENLSQTVRLDMIDVEKEDLMVRLKDVPTKTSFIKFSSNQNNTSNNVTNRKPLKCRTIDKVIEQETVEKVQSSEIVDNIVNENIKQPTENINKIEEPVQKKILTKRKKL